jgi:peptidoglycan/LPS O-acetylase OafA/YrhL
VDVFGHEVEFTGVSYTVRLVRRVLLTIAMLLMGMALVGGAAAALVPTTLFPLDQEVGTHTSAAGAVLGIGLMAAAVNPAANVAWVRAGILYGLVVLAFEAGAYFFWHEQFHIGPVFFGLAFSLLLIALYPHRRELVPETGKARKPEKLEKPKEEKPEAAPPASESGPEPVPPPSSAAGGA